MMTDINFATTFGPTDPVTGAQGGVCRKGSWAASLDPKRKPMQNILFQHFDITFCEAALIAQVSSQMGRSTVDAVKILNSSDPHGVDIVLRVREIPGEPFAPTLPPTPPAPAPPAPPTGEPDPVAPGGEPGDTEGDLGAAPDPLAPSPPNGENGAPDDFVPPGSDPTPPGQRDFEALLKQVPKEAWIVGGVILAFMLLK